VPTCRLGRASSHRASAMAACIDTSPVREGASEAHKDGYKMDIASPMWRAYAFSFIPSQLSQASYCSVLIYRTTHHGVVVVERGEVGVFDA
jgi:hypothetical protein